MTQNDLFKKIASVALLLSPKLREAAGELARELGPDAVAGLVDRLDAPAVSAEEAGVNPTFAFEWPWKWTVAILETVGGLGTPGAAALWPLVTDARESVSRLALVVLFRMPADAGDAPREILLAELRGRLPKFHRNDVPIYPIIYSMVSESRRNPALGEVLTALREVVVLDPKKKKRSLGDIVGEIVRPPAPPALPPDLPGHKEFAERFAGAITAHDLGAIHSMLAPALQKKRSPAKLETEIAGMSSHCGWPVRYEGASFGGFRASDLRSGPEFRLPKSVSDAAFRNWMWVEFLPVEESDSDFAFKMGIAIVEAEGALKVGYYWMTASD